MQEIYSLFLIGVALSMDTFSLALSIGTFISNKKALSLSSIVGIFHFFMPIFGMIIGNQLIKTFRLDGDVLLGIILLFIAMQMLFDFLKKDDEHLKLSFLGMLFFAFGVSIDSFSVGIGMNALTNHIILATSIFAICSFSFTFSGIILGNYAKKKIGILANFIGFIILFILGLSHLL